MNIHARLRWPLLGCVLLVLLPRCRTVRSAEEPWPEAMAERLREATVGIERSGELICTAALVDRPDLVLTAAHCLPRNRMPGTRLLLRFANGQRAVGRVAVVDVDQDFAVLSLERPAPLAPLQLADSQRLLQDEHLLFLGRPTRGRPMQQAVLKRRGQCPTLLAVDDALFADYRGEPGDSGAPLLSRDGVVGIVHGGQGCRIAIPSSRIAPRLRQLSTVR